MNYYNEYEPFAVEWLKELIREGLIPEGEIDNRSIVDVEPSDLKDFTQCHFFAGIGGWAYAARLAGWRDDRPMWTGSPPCQPFSVAGKQKGTDDERHLWPVWFRLVRECRPPIIFGEQVAAAIRQGWLDSLQEDLEAENYACAAAVLPASGIGALHKRDRLWIVAYASGSGRQGWSGSECSEQREIRQNGALCSSDRGCIAVANSNDIGHQWHERAGREAERRAEYAGIAVGSVAVTDSSDRRPIEESEQSQRDTRREPDGNSGVINTPAYANDCSRAMGNTEHSGSHDSEERRGNEEAGSGSAQGQDIPVQSQGASGCAESGDICGNGFWNEVQAVQCKDGKVRAIPTEPEIFPLANGISNRVGILRGAGNAIVPQVAAEIIKVFT